MVRKVLILALTASLALGGSLGAAQVKTATQPPDSQPQVPNPNLPDLLVDEIKFIVESTTDGITSLRIYYTISNQANFPSRCCPTEEGKKAWNTNPVENFLFHVSLEARDYPSGKYQRVSLGSTELIALGKMTFNHLDPVPAGKKRQYRVKVDAENWIKEKSDTNNEKEARWPYLAIQPPIKK